MKLPRNLAELEGINNLSAEHIKVLTQYILLYFLLLTLIS